MSNIEDNVPEINIDETPPQVDIKPVEFSHREPKGLAELSPHTEEEHKEFVERVQSQDSLTEESLEESKVTYKAPKQNTTQTAAFSLPVKDPTKYEGEFLDIPGNTREQIEFSLGRTPNINLASDKDGRDWRDSVIAGLDLLPADKVLQSTIEKDTKYFEQGIDSEVGRLGSAYPKFKEFTPGMLSGDKAAIRMMAHLKLGSIVQIPLWHSGIWLTLKAPSEIEILELHRRLTDEKIQLGRRSYGIIHSNSGVYTTEVLTDFVLRNIYQTTISDLNDTNIKDLIKIQDHHTLLWGLACAIYPNGFQFRRACTANPAKCVHTVTERLNLTKLEFTDHKAFTPEQVAHMTKRRPNSVSVADVKRYQNSLLSTQNRKITIDSQSGGNVSFILRTPTLTEFIDSGNRWVSNIVSGVVTALGTDATEERKNEIIDMHSRATQMREYSHWIESMEFGENTVEDKESIERLLNDLSADDVMRIELMNGIAKYISDSTVSLIGIPNFNCPVCGELQKNAIDSTGKEKTYPRLTEVLALDTYQVFFTLVEQRRLRISQR